jgi:pimeloyl-ACP methyl ester carboxylesterase
MYMELQSQVYIVNNVKLHTLEAGDAHAPIMLFLHGFPEFSYSWLKQLSYFAGQGYRVIAPDQRGYNLSSKPMGIQHYQLKYLIDDIATLINVVTNKPVTLIGHDWGGGVAWTLAQHHPQLLQKLIILNMPHLQVMKQTLKSSFKQLLKSWYAGFFQIPLLPEVACRAFNYKLLERSMIKTANAGAFSQQDMIAYKEAWQQPGAVNAMINWYRAYRKNKLNTNLQIEVPTLIIWGKKDKFLNASMAVKSLDKCKQGKLIMLDNATHWLHHEQPDAINRMIHNFIRE